jgi:glycosyltransferase involved in cell wall biosynthesis
LKILGFCNTDFTKPWGDSVRLGSLMDGLCLRGHQVWLISSRPEFNVERPAVKWRPKGSFLVSEVMFPGWLSLPPPLGRPNGFLRRSCSAPLMLRRAEEELESSDVEACYAMMPGIASSLPAIRFGRLRGSRVVLDFPDLDVYIKPKFVSRYSVRNADAVLVVSEYLKEVALSYGADESRVFYVPNGVDVGEFGPEKAGSRLKELVGERKKVLYAGSLQDLRSLIAAAEIVVKERPDVSFIILGEGQLRGSTAKDWAERVRKQGLSPFFHFLGRLPRGEMPEMMAEADVCVESMDDRPYFRAAQPIKVLEYMASGRPVVAPDLTGIRGMVADGRDGLLFSPGDDRGFADRILRALDPEEGRRLGVAARRKVEREFTWERSVGALEDVLHRLVG